MVSLVFWMKRKWSASLTFVDEIANGACTLYDSIGRLDFEGYFVNGYREGKELMRMRMWYLIDSSIME